ncbi:MAG: Gfo/Idh/MocA family oxidoreductase [Fimbriimonadaceae bacterium]|nr:Gfo/Idh/MocA family oxidoreductase [Fimbriimonadaceae bacterium]
MKDATNPAAVTRRQLLCGATAAGVGALLGPVRARAQVAANARLNVAVIGLGAMGRGHLGWALGDPALQVVAVCDVDRLRAEESLRRAETAYADRAGSSGYRGPQAINDYREILADPAVDAVVIATPDHWHALQAIDAAKAGKDVYCEKPISLTIAEGRRVREVMRQYGCIFQTGTQYRSIATLRKVVEFVRGGGLGQVQHAFTLWSRVEGGYTPVSYPLPAEPVPAGLDWDLWVGPAPWRPYNSRFHRNPLPGVVPWAFCDDFGAASVTWHHSHAADVTQYALGVEETSPVEIHHPVDGKFPTLTMRFANGVLLHLVDDWGVVKSVYQAVPADARLEGNFGGVFVGERGWLSALYGKGRCEGQPEGLFAEMGMPRHEVGWGNDHHRNWLDCLASRARPQTDAELGHRAAAIGHLAHIAFKLHRSLRYDPVKESFVDDSEANRLCSRALREPWRM